MNTAKPINPHSHLRIMSKILLLLAVLVSTGTVYGQACPINTPATNATINGTSYAITGSISGYPSAAHVVISFDGEVQPVVGSALTVNGNGNWSMVWNTNLRYDNPGYGFITATVYDSTNAVICTATNTGITINNGFRYTPSQISFTGVHLNSINGGTCPSITAGSTWTGECQIVGNFSGTNSGTDALSVHATVDGADTITLGVGSQTGPVVSTFRFPNGTHNLCAYAWDSSILAGAVLPVGEWCAPITFSNGSAASEIILGPKNWTIAPSGTIQLTCTILNADGTSGGACSSPTWDTFAYNTVGATLPHSTQFCSVSSTGLVTATTGIAWGGCFVTVSVSGLHQRWIAGQIGTTGPIPHFGSDGQIHTTCTSVSDCMWVATTFETGPTISTSVSGAEGFLDQQIQSRLSLLGNPFNQVGYNTLEPGAGGAPMQLTQAQFNSGMTAQLNTYNNIASLFSLYFHPNLSSIVSCAGGGTHDDAFYSWVLGEGAALTGGPALSQVAAAWQGTGRTIGFENKDEINYAGPLNYPGAIGTIGATGGPTSITTDGSGNRHDQLASANRQSMGARFSSVRL